MMNAKEDASKFKNLCWKTTFHEVYCHKYWGIVPLNLINPEFLQIVRSTIQTDVHFDLWKCLTRLCNDILSAEKGI